MSLARFQKRMVIRAKVLPGNAAKLQRKVALAIDQNIVLATPVDTGRARSNWIVKSGAPSTSLGDAYIEGEEGSTAGANANAALAQARAAILLHRVGPIHITNNLPYIAVLNDGSSDQAPKNFVENGVRTGTAQVLGRRIRITGP